MADETNNPIVTQQPVVTTENNTSTVVGLSALTLPTPDKVKAFFKMVTFFTIVVGLVLNGISSIPVPIKEECLEYMGVLVLILQKAEDFFGIRVN